MVKSTTQNFNLKPPQTATIFLSKMDVVAGSTATEYRTKHLQQTVKMVCTYIIHYVCELPFFCSSDHHCNIATRIAEQRG